MLLIKQLYCHSTTFSIFPFYKKVFDNSLCVGLISDCNKSSHGYLNQLLQQSEPILFSVDLPYILIHISQKPCLYSKVTVNSASHFIKLLYILLELVK